MCRLRLFRHLGIRPTRSGLTTMSASLWRSPFQLLGLTPSRESLLLASIVRTRFVFVVLAGVAVEMQNLLRIFGLRHGASPSETNPIASAWWPFAVAPAS